MARLGCGAAAAVALVALLLLGVLSGRSEAVRSSNADSKFSRETCRKLCGYFCLCGVPFIDCICTVADDKALQNELHESQLQAAIMSVGTAVQQQLDVGGLVWCVARPSTPDNVLQQLLDYSCSQGADCSPIQAGDLCSAPDTLYAHASFAVNDYWQNMRAKGATCDFQGAAMLVTSDPSFGQCNYPGGPALTTTITH